MSNLIIALLSGAVVLAMVVYKHYRRKRGPVYKTDLKTVKEMMGPSPEPAAAIKPTPRGSTSEIRLPGIRIIGRRLAG
ncbi:MAG: hypothetical protein AB199_03845 [Parcubacteria bacterium C7867-004]|nr:MAG: hypothetical protein AB199_03845 [Parcubacteria bacterium C7867-004]